MYPAADIAVVALYMLKSLSAEVLSVPSLNASSVDAQAQSAQRHALLSLPSWAMIWSLCLLYAQCLWMQSAEALSVHF